MTTVNLNKSVADAGERNVLLAFPNRAVVVNYAGSLNNPWLLGGLAILFATIVVFLLYWKVPNLVSDAKMSWGGKAIPEENADVSGSCKTMKFIFIDCDAKITYRPDPQAEAVTTIEQSFLFVGFSHSNSVGVLRSTSDPSLVTTTLATDHLVNRMLTLLALVAIICALAGTSAYEARNTFRRRKLEGKPALLRPVLAAIVQADEKRNVTFEALIDGVSVRSVNRMRASDTPLYAATGHALAVWVESIRHLILLDEQLSVIELNDDERARIRAAL
jgi:hypothetical protein